MQSTKYRLLAIDVDGTLIGTDGLVTPEAAAAVAAAGEAGVGVCLATGRSYAETMPVWWQLPLCPPYQPLVLVGGALVSEPDTGRTLYQQTIPRELAFRFADALAAEGHCAMALVDPWRWGVDYYLAETGDVAAVERLWFSKMRVRIQRARRLSETPGFPSPLRINAVAEPSEAARLAEVLRKQFDGQLAIHSIFAPNYGVTVVEAFVAPASKWTAVVYVAQAMQIGPGLVAAIGDDVNDVPMLKHAGLGAAMPNSPPAVKAFARHVAADGLPAFLRDLVAGRFDDLRAELV